MTFFLWFSYFWSLRFCLVFVDIVARSHCISTDIDCTFWMQINKIFKYLNNQTKAIFCTLLHALQHLLGNVIIRIVGRFETYLLLYSFAIFKFIITYSFNKTLNCALFLCVCIVEKASSFLFVCFII